MRVSVESYNPEWAEQFQNIKHELEGFLRGASYEGIEHVGSTSVPGLPSKPIIDIDIIVKRADLGEALEALAKAGYRNMGEWGVPDRHAFRQPRAYPTRNLYVCIEGCQALRNHLAVRDICRRDSEVRNVYGRTKLELAQKEWGNVDEYCEAKNDVIDRILTKAGMKQDDRDEIRRLNTVPT